MTQPGAGAGQNGLGVEFQVMDTAAAHVDQVQNDIGGLLRQVTGSVEALAVSWAGGANQAFQAVMADWNAQGQKLNEALRGIAETMRENRSTFDGAEEDVRASITRVGTVDPLRL